MAKKVFIDGKAGTTGLRIYERLESRNDIEIITLSDELRKDINAKRKALNAADIAFLCLPDDAARESVSLIENDNTVVIDTSTAHRTDEGQVYGYPELSKEDREAIKNGKRIAVPGYYATGFITIIYPLKPNIPKKGRVSKELLDLNILELFLSRHRSLFLK